MAGFFSSSSVERVRAASDIVEVVGAHVPLKRAGANFVALCPFHKEKSPSFNVNPRLQIFHCFGCHKGGDVFNFIKEFENVDFPEAVRRLAERARIPLEYEGGAPEPAGQDIREALRKIHEQITTRWQNALATEASGSAARDYLASRAVSAEAIKLFRIGFAPDAWDDTVNWSKSQGHDIGLVEKAGLILRKEGSDRFYDRFRGRLMFPICDEQGRVIGFSGRILSGDEKTAKYVNSPETPLFTKSKVFFGLDKSKRALLDAGFAIVCEGQLDMISCFMAGVQNVVAPQGTALTSDHARILKRYVPEVVLCFDSDAAGQNAAVRSLDSLLEAGLAVRVAVVPAPHDPDSFIKESGADAFRKMISEAEGFFDFHLARLCVLNNVGEDRGRLAILQAMSEAVHKTGNAVLIDKYAQKTALRLGVSHEAVRAEFQRLKKALRTTAKNEAIETQPSNPVAPPSPHEQQLLKLLLLHDELLPWATTALDINWVQHTIARQIISQRMEAHARQSWPGMAAFVQSFPEASAQGLITESITTEREVPNPAQQIKDVVQRLRNLDIERQVSALMRRASVPEVTDTERAELIRQQWALQLLRRQPVV
jgi:DNA primase